MLKRWIAACAVTGMFLGNVSAAEIIWLEDSLYQFLGLATMAPFNDTAAYLMDNSGKWPTPISLVNMEGQSICKISYAPDSTTLCSALQGEVLWSEDSSTAITLPDGYMQKYSEGYQWVGKQNEQDQILTGMIDTQGKLVIPFTMLPYQVSGDFHEGKAMVAKDGKYGYLDMTGKLVIPYTWERAGDFHEGRACVAKTGEHYDYGIIDEQGHTILPCAYDYIKDFSEGLAAVFNKGKWCFVDKQGKVVIPYASYQEVMPFHGGLAAVKRNGVYGFLNAQGKMAIPMKWGYVEDFQSYQNKVYPDTAIDYFARIFDKGKYGVIKKDGTLSVPCIYDSIGPFSNGRAAATKNNKIGVIDFNGRVLLPFLYQDAVILNQKYVAVKQDGKCGILQLGQAVFADGQGSVMQETTEQGTALVYRNAKNGQVMDTFLVPNDTASPEQLPNISSCNALYCWGEAGLYKIKDGRMQQITKHAVLDYGFDPTDGSHVVITHALGVRIPYGSVAGRSTGDQIMRIHADGTEELLFQNRKESQLILSKLTTASNGKVCFSAIDTAWKSDQTIQFEMINGKISIQDANQNTTLSTEAAREEQARLDALGIGIGKIR